MLAGSGFGSGSGGFAAGVSGSLQATGQGSGWAAAGPAAAKKKWAEDMQARFPKGTFARIAAVLKQFEDRTDLVREAVEREIQRREAEKKKPTKR